MRRPGFLRPLPLLTISVALVCLPHLQIQEDGGVSPTDGGGTGVLESIYVPNFPNAGGWPTHHLTSRTTNTVGAPSIRSFIADGWGCNTVRRPNYPAYHSIG